jgi:homocitrate synthase NifV
MASTLVHLVDTTLRDGLQAPGLTLSYRQRMDVALQLIEAGIDEIEAGIPVQDNLEMEFIKELTKSNPSTTRITAWCRPMESDLTAAIDAKVDSIHISFPLSKRLMDLHNHSSSDTMERMKKFARLASNYFPHISLGAQDACRTETSVLQEFVSLANEVGAWKIRIADTVGSSTPFQIKSIFSQLKSPKAILEFHGHNDLGLALGNSFAALESGAKAISGTILGIGERAGNTALEELVVALKMSNFLLKGPDPGKFYSLGKHLSELLGESIHPRKPICGSKVFTHESGIHTHGLLKDRLSYQPFLPEDLGRASEEFEFGPSSGASNIEALFPGFDFSQINLKEIASTLRKKIKSINFVPNDAWIKTEVNKLIEDYQR